MLVGVDFHLPGPVSVIVVDWDVRAVDGKLLKIWTIVAAELGIEIGEWPSL